MWSSSLGGYLSQPQRLCHHIQVDSEYKLHRPQSANWASPRLDSMLATKRTESQRRPDTGKAHLGQAHTDRNTHIYRHIHGNIDWHTGLVIFYARAAQLSLGLDCVSSFCYGSNWSTMHASLKATAWELICKEKEWEREGAIDDPEVAHMHMQMALGYCNF